MQRRCSSSLSLSWGTHGAEPTAMTTGVPPLPPSVPPCPGAAAEPKAIEAPQGEPWMSTASPRRAPGRARGLRRALGTGASLPGNAVVGVPTGFWKEQDLSKSIYSQAGGTKPSQPLQAASVCHRTFPMGIRTWSVHPCSPRASSPCQPHPSTALDLGEGAPAPRAASLG